MIRILLVDDDPFFHTTFLSIVDWNSLGCSITCQAESGQQAIALLARQAIDVMITDMVMPGMNGVELIHYVRQEYPHVKCVALSSFDDFDYVRKSMREGAVDYLLKHVLNRDTIQELITSLSPASQSTHVLDERHIFSDMMAAMIQDGNVSSAQLEHIIRELNVSFPEPPLLAVSIRLQDVTALLKRFEQNDRYMQFLSTTTNIIQGALEHYGRALCACNRHDTVYAVISNERFFSRLYASQVCHLLKKSLPSILNRYCNVNVAIATNSTCDTLDDVLPAFHTLEAELACQAGTDYLREQCAETPVISIRLETERCLVEWMQNGTFEDIQRTICDEFNACRAQSPSRNAIAHISVEFLNLLNRICKNEGIPLAELFPSDSSPYSVATRISSFAETVGFITDGYRVLYTRLHDQIDPDNIIVQNALRVIRSRYHEDISLSSVAETIHYSAAYLSRIFKSETGKGFVQYLTDYRLARARQLMDSRAMPLRLVAERTGFPNYNYFSRIFKQRFGETPQEYIKRGKYGVGTQQTE